MEKKYVYLFKEGNASMRNLLGGKGANLAEMTNLNIPVPTGFTVTTEACTKYYEDGKKISSEIMEQVNKSVKVLEETTGKDLFKCSQMLLWELKRDYSKTKLMK